MSGLPYEVGPLTGMAEKRSRERAERRALAFQKAAAEHRQAMCLTVAGEPLPPREVAEIRRDMGCAKHAQTWFHEFTWRRASL